MAMHRTADQGPEGALRLYFQTDESGYGSHTEIIRSAKIVPDDEAASSVVLVVDKTTHDAIRQFGEQKGKAVSIPVATLIALIEKHGKERDYLAYLNSHPET